MATHRRRISAPYCLMTSWGNTVLPSDFDILRPCSSMVKPWVTTVLYGARPRDRKSVVSGKSVSVRVVMGGRRFITKKNKVHERRTKRQTELNKKRIIKP